jgi:hypothetical protein
MTFAGRPSFDSRNARLLRALARCTVVVALACAAPGTDDTVAAATSGSVSDGGDGSSSESVADRLTLLAQDTVRRDSVADMPRATVDARPAPVTGKTIRVGPRANLQSALNRAQPGDAVLLTAGATYEGNFTLPTRRCGGGWITVRTDTPDDSLPAEGERITPAFSGRLAKIVTPNTQPALKAANPTCQWRLFALEISGTLPITKIQYGLVLLGDGGDRSSGETQTSLDRVPADLVIDRVYIHGSPTLNSFRCLAINSARSAVVNSWLSECHAKGFDSQAIEGWNGPGPYLIENNTLEAAGENVMFGGADAAIRNLTPSDITIRRNHIRKPPEWKGAWSVKNLFELKHARRVLVEGNVFENNWADGQAGVAIVLKSTNQGGGNPWAQTSDVTFRNNIVRNSPQGLIIAAAPDVIGDKYPVIPATRFRVEQNLFDHIGTFNGSTNGNMLLLMNNLSDITVAHNTFASNYDEGLFVTLETAPPGSARNIEITDNVVTKARYYAIIHSGIKVGTESMNTFAGARWKFARNVVVGVGREYVSYHPPGNSYPAAMDDVGFVDWRQGDYRLKGGSQYTGRGAKGTNPGADLGRVARETANVVVSPTGRQARDAGTVPAR